MSRIIPNVAGGSESDIKESITKGRQVRMPAHGEFLGETKVHLIGYLYL